MWWGQEWGVKQCGYLEVNLLEFAAARSGKARLRPASGLPCSHSDHSGLICNLLCGLLLCAQLAGSLHVPFRLGSQDLVNREGRKREGGNLCVGIGNDVCQARVGQVKPISEGAVTSSRPDESIVEARPRPDLAGRGSSTHGVVNGGNLDGVQVVRGAREGPAKDPAGVDEAQLRRVVEADVVEQRGASRGQHFVRVA